jgi:hypothetical protein
MAAQFTPEEIAEIFEAYNNAIKSGTPITADLAKQMKDAAAGVKGYAQAQENLFKSLGKSVADYTKEMYKGEQGAKAFNNSIDTVTTALEALMVLLPFVRGLSVVTKLATVGLYGFLKGVKLAGEQSDKLYKSYQDLSRAGAATAGGMTEVFENMQKFGYGLEELEQMTALVKANSKELGLFIGTVGQGTRLLADTAESIQRSGIQREFLNMGMKVDDINKSIAGYIVQQGRLGRLQSMTQAEINAGARAYIKEMEILTRLTGQTREEMEQQRESANAIDQFYATVEEMGPAGEELYKTFNQLMAVDPSKAKAFAESVSGFMGFSEDQNKLYMATGGALMKNVEALKNGSMNSAQFLNSLGGAINENKTMLSSFAKIGAEEFGGFYSNMKLGQKDFVKGAQDAAASLKPMDGVTDSATALRQSQMQARDSLQSFVNLGVKPATDALATMARGGAGGAGMLPGGGGKPPMGGGGAGQMDYGKELYGKGKATLGDLRIKSSEAYGGGETSPQLINVAKQIQDKLGGDLLHFSAFNDTYERGGNSLHRQGRALDFTLTDSSKAAAIAAMIQGIPGISKVIDEYNNPSRSATGGHIHAEISAANGAVLSGPMSGYKPNLTMHGTEAIVPLTNAMNEAMGGMGFGNEGTSLLGRQLDKLDELVRVMQNQVSVSTKILQAAN